MVTPGQLNRRAALFEQLAAMISAGVPLTKAMEMAGRNRSIGVSPQVIQQLTHHLQEGHTFSDAMQLMSGQKRGVDVSLKPSKAYWLTDFDVALLSAGEESGRLDAIFKLLARYYASRAKIIHDTISGLITTAATLHVFILVFPLTYLTNFAQGIFDSDYSKCIPFIIDKILTFGVLYGMIFFLIFACQGNRGEGWRALVESIFRIVPLLGKALKYLAVARLACALEALTNAGVPVIRSWEMAGAACGSPRLNREILKWTPQLETGTTPAEMVNQIQYFPEMFSNLYHTAEISGKLDEALNRLNTYFEEEGFRILQMFTRIMNGTIYGLLVLVVARSIIGFYVGHFNIDQLMNGL
ncbi:MAG TPA: type II secretion system F family protein [Verrucomicrobiae bacterium]|jgi:type IV pilus assembly protein PilC|nr:type II secretion system F family protein [Verrucomicrobiae bacterium]